MLVINMLGTVYHEMGYADISQGTGESYGRRPYSGAAFEAARTAS